MESLFARQKRLLSITSTEIVRDIMHEINWDKHLISIRGNRGVGKTTLMLQYLKLNYPLSTTEALYCSLDSLYFSTHTLVELAENFTLMGGKHLLLDEIHKYPSWSREIKEIYDSYPELKITISGSSLLNIINADADLSRRCRPYEMHGLSFREYLKFYHNIEIPKYTLNNILTNADNICNHVCSITTPLLKFKEYLKYGYYPFYDGNHEDYYIAIENIIKLIVTQELPQLRGVDPAYSRKLESLLYIIATTVPYELNVTNLGTCLEMNRNTVLSYINHLTEAGLLKALYSDIKSVKRMQKPDKIFIHDPNMLYALANIEDAKIGTIRETFVINQLSAIHEIEYGKAQGDFKVDGKYTFEVGGKDKSFTQIANIPNSYILADDMNMPVGNKLPIWLVGLLY